MPKIAIDFDGVLAHYTPGMASRDEIGLMIDGACCALRKLKQDGFSIIIWTSRQITDNLRKWLSDYNIPYDEIISKPDCSIFIDDRALTFTGNWNKTLVQIARFREWWRKR